MNVGMLWFDNDPRIALTAKVARAADYYRRKYGLVPDLCLVHPSMLPGLPPGQVEAPAQPAPVPQVQVSEVEGLAGKVAVRPNRLIQPGHLWIGKEDQN
jgi:hypothetical protein